MKVLIGIDGSPSSHTAVEFASRLLAEGDQMALYSTPLKVSMKSGGHLHADVQKRADKALTDVLFADAIELLPEFLRDRVETFVSDQSPAKELTRIAEQCDADLIVVGSRGLTGLQSMVMGSVAKGVAKHSRIPVLVVRPREDPTPERLDILFAYQDDAAGACAAAKVGQLQWPPGSRGRLLGVIDSKLPMETPDWLAERQQRDEETAGYAAAWEDEHQQDREAEQKKLNQLHEELPDCFHGEEPIVGEGLPVEQILNTIDREQIDLLVLGAHTRNWWRWLSEGSVSQQIIDTAPCSVLVIPELELSTST